MDLPSSREALIWLLLSPINIAIRDFFKYKSVCSGQAYVFCSPGCKSFLGLVSTTSLERFSLTPISFCLFWPLRSLFLILRLKEPFGGGLDLNLTWGCCPERLFTLGCPWALNAIPPLPFVPLSLFIVTQTFHFSLWILTLI